MRSWTQTEESGGFLPPPGIWFYDHNLDVSHTFQKLVKFQGVLFLWVRKKLQFQHFSRFESSLLFNSDFSILKWFRERSSDSHLFSTAMVYNWIFSIGPRKETICHANNHWKAKLDYSEELQFLARIYTFGKDKNEYRKELLFNILNTPVIYYFLFI